MIQNTLTVFRKELMETLRDRKTLFFTLFVPILTTPALILLMSALVIAIERRMESQPIIVAASPATQQVWRNLVHDWFLHSEFGQQLQDGDISMLEALTETPTVPEDIFKNTQHFEQWTRTIAASAKPRIDTLTARTKEPLASFSEEQQEETIRAYQLLIRAMGKVQFIDPEKLPTAPDGASTNKIPEGLQSLPDIEAITAAIKNKKIHAALFFEDNNLDLQTLLDNDQQAVSVTIVGNSTLSLSAEAKQRFSTAILQIGNQLADLRLAAREIDSGFLHPLPLDKHADLATPSQIIFSLAGGLLPYVVILYAFLGAIYPAIDLGAGEKERQTLETLLLAPVSRTAIASGKFLVLLSTSLTAALLGLTTMASSVYLLVPQAILEKMELNISAGTFGLLAFLALPPAAAFSGIFLAISIYARSFKEAQNYMVPVQLLIFVPVMAGMLPGLELNVWLAMVPLVNISLLCREFLKGDIQMGYYALSLLSCLSLAALCVAFAVRQFHKESVLFRT